VFAAAGPGDPNAERLSAAAVRLVLRAAPAARFAAMALADAEALALTRLLHTRLDRRARARRARPSAAE